MVSVDQETADALAVGRWRVGVPPVRWVAGGSWRSWFIVSFLRLRRSAKNAAIFLFFFEKKVIDKLQNVLYYIDCG